MSFKGSLGFANYQVVDTACKQLAHAAAKQARLGTKEGGIAVSRLFEIRRTINHIGESLRQAAQISIKLPPPLSMTKSPVTRFHLRHTHFGRLICDQSVEGLAGTAFKAPIYRPVQLTLVADRGNFAF